MITLLLIRGLSRQQGHWGEFPAILTRTASQHGLVVNLVFQDLPGFGQRHRQKSPSSIEKIAEYLVPSLENLFVETGQKVHLIGISMGGMVALELARRFPEYCESLVMINSSVKPVSRFYERLRPRAYAAVIKALFHPSNRESERQILTLSTCYHQNNNDLLDHWLSLRTKQPPNRVAAFKQMLAAAKFQAPVEPPLKKILLIASKKDQIAHYSCTLKLAKLWHLDYLIEYNAGHDLALDAPGWLASAIVKFLIK